FLTSSQFGQTGTDLSWLYSSPFVRLMSRVARATWVRGVLNSPRRYYNNSVTSGSSQNTTAATSIPARNIVLTFSERKFRDPNDDASTVLQAKGHAKAAKNYTKTPKLDR